MSAKPIRNAEKLIERFGGIRPMASKTDIPVTTIQGWKKRGVVPPSRFDEITKAADEHNINIQDLLQDKEGANENARQQSGDTGHAEAPQDKTAMKQNNQGDSGHDTHQNLHETLQQSMIRDRQKTLQQGVIITVALILLTGGVGWYLLQPNLSQIEENTQNIGQLEQDVANIDGNVSALEQQIDDQGASFGQFMPESWQDQISQLREQAARAQEGVNTALKEVETIRQDVLGEDAGSFQTRVAKLSEHAARISGSEQLAALANRLTALDDTEDGQMKMDQSVTEINALIQNMGGDLSGFETTLETARNQSSALNDTLGEVPAEDLKAGALLLGLAQFRSTLNRGQEPFAEDLNLLLKLVGEDDPALRTSLERLAPHAEQGVLTPEGLTTEFKGLTGDIVIASLKGEDVSVGERAQARFGELFALEKDGERITGTPVQKKVAKAETLLQEGNLEQAISLMQTLDGPAANVVRPWIQKAQATLQAQQAKKMLSSDMVRDLFNGQIPALGGQLFIDEKTGIELYRPAGR